MVFSQVWDLFLASVRTGMLIVIVIFVQICFNAILGSFFICSFVGFQFLSISYFQIENLNVDNAACFVFLKVNLMPICTYIQYHWFLFEY